MLNDLELLTCVSSIKVVCVNAFIEYINAAIRNNKIRFIMVKDLKKYEFVLICATKVIINIHNANFCRGNATFVYNNCRFCNLYVAKRAHSISI